MLITERTKVYHIGFKNSCEQSLRTQLTEFPLKLPCDISLVNHPIKLDTKLICTLKTDMIKSFKSNKKVNAIAATDMEIIGHEALYIEYEQFKLNDNFSQCLEPSLLSKKVLHTSSHQQIGNSIGWGYIFPAT